MRLHNKKLKILFLLFVINLSFISDLPQTQAQELKIISRAEWGANESYRFDSNSQNKWLEEYAPVVKFIIHHTGTTLKDTNKDGSVDQKDYIEIIKSIYNWHAQVLNWGDIGYNYLIDPLGNIYEGRYGGDGVVGGHALDDVKKVGYNRGSIGIVVLGTYGGWVYEKEQGEYLKRPDLYPQINGLQTINQEENYKGSWRVWIDGKISPQSKESLTSLIAAKAKKFNFSPMGYGDFVDLKNIPNIIGHRDVDRTTCPGEHIYLSLSETRQLAQNKFDQTVQATTINKIFAGSLQGQSDSEITLRANEKKDIWLEYKNEGNTSWENFGSDEIYLATSEKKDQMLGKAVNQEPEIIKLPKSVPVGEKIKFNLTITPPPTGIKAEKTYQLFWGNKSWIPNSDAKISLKIIREDYAVEKISSTFPEQSWVGEVIPVQIKFRNLGLKSWPKDKISLKIFNDKYKPSTLKNSDWKTGYGEFKPTVAKEIKPNEEVIFNFKIKTPATPQDLKTVFRLDIKGISKIVDNESQGIIKIKPTYSAELLSQTLPEVMVSGKTYSVMLKIKNDGKKDWDKNLSLKIYNENGKTSSFYDSSWVSYSTVEKSDGKVESSKEVAFTFKLKAPKTAGNYKIKLTLTQGSNKVYINEDSQLLLTVKVNSK